MDDWVRVRVGCEFKLAAAAPTHAIIQVEPSRTQLATIHQEQWTFEPRAHRRGYRDVYGNLCQRVELPVGASSIRYDALVDVPNELDDIDETAKEIAPGALPDDVLVYTLPSRYCLSDELAGDALRLFGTIPPGWARVQGICDYVHNTISFRYGASSPLTTAVDVHTACEGVCRDFAHLAITFCRALNIPARYAFGYMADIAVPVDPAPMDFCAWTEVWLGGRWYTFDPRNNKRRIGRVHVGRGRDALDCAMLTTFGHVGLDSMVVWADEVSMASLAERP
jgi:transglutaminase-like putative cysteine protease